MEITLQFTRVNGGGDRFVDELTAAFSRLATRVTRRDQPRLCQLVPWTQAFIRESSYDVLLSDVFSWPLRRRARRHIVVVYHLLDDPLFRLFQTPQQKLYYKYLSYHQDRTLSRADTILAISNYTHNQLLLRKGVQAVSLRCGVDANVYCPPVERPLRDKIRLLFTGNLIRRKGAHLLSAIMHELGDNYELYVTGGIRGKRLHYHGKECKNIFQLGRLSGQELVLAYQQSDVFLFPSYLEGFGYSVAEAMACGLPTVCSNNSSLVELVSHEQAGILCQTGEISSYVEAIKTVSKDTQLRQRLGRNARQAILNGFTQEHFEKSVQDFLAQQQLL